MHMQSIERQLVEEQTIYVPSPEGFLSYIITMKMIAVELFVIILWRFGIVLASIHSHFK